jgi:tripartite-type tricarboxylate transporter receptor subunit TctC
MQRRTVLSILATAPAASAFAQPAYPSRTMRFVIPWPPGQATDLAGRVIAQKLSESLGQAAMPDNKPGAGGMLGTDHVAKAPADGYTILVASSGPITLNPLLQKTPYDVERDFIPVAMMGVSPYLLVTGPAFPASTAKEFVALVKANPGKYTFASSGTGATAHVIAELFNQRAGLTATHVPYKGQCACAHRCRQRPGRLRHRDGGSRHAAGSRRSSACLRHHPGQTDLDRAGHRTAGHFACAAGL